jgi:pimeloyl-ACP methyl ester carboxylesterase/DNA-binding SARP family transcriptional activator
MSTTRTFDRAWRASELAAPLGVNTATVLKAILAGKVRAIRVSDRGDVRIPVWRAPWGSPSSCIRTAASMTGDPSMKGWSRVIVGEHVAPGVGRGGDTCGVVEVRLFGPIEVRVDSDCLGPRDFGGVKPKQLFEALLVQRGRPLAKDQLAEMIWGEALPRKVAATIESYVSLLRSRLGAARVLVVTEAGGYRAELCGVQIDLDTFDSLVRAAAIAPPAERRQRLEAAVAIAAGAVLEDEPFAEWAMGLRRMYAERRLRAMCDLAETCLALEEPQAAVDLAERALVLDPLLERAHRVAIIGQYAIGEEGRALRAYERCRVMLLEELGATPAPATVATHVAILRHEDARTLIADPAGPGADVPVAPPGLTGTRYARNGEVGLAYQTLGNGSPDLLFVPGFVSHVEAAWEEPTYAGFMRRLGTGRRLIIFDKRGTGLSDAVVEWPTFRERVEDMFAVMDAAGSERAVLFGVSEGGAMCALAAARHPERVAGLMLHAVFARILRAPDYPRGWTLERLDDFLDSFEEAWTTGAGLEIINPSLAGNHRYLRWYARYLRLGASPGMARRLMRMNAEIDLTEVLPTISVPTLVLHRKDERWVEVEHGRYVAERIPGARLVLLPGVDHQPWIGETDPVHRAIDEFIEAL